MARVRVLVGTRKGAFALTADGARREWEVRGSFFPGLEALPPGRLPRGPGPDLEHTPSGWFGQQIHWKENGSGPYRVLYLSVQQAKEPSLLFWYGCFSNKNFK